MRACIPDAYVKSYRPTGETSRYLLTLSPHVPNVVHVNYMLARDICMLARGASIYTTCSHICKPRIRRICMHYACTRVHAHIYACAHACMRMHAHTYICSDTRAYSIHALYMRTYTCMPHSGSSSSMGYNIHAHVHTCSTHACLTVGAPRAWAARGANQTAQN